MIPDDWRDTEATPPPDDQTPIELRFRGDESPLRTTGASWHSNVATFGRPAVPVTWRPAAPE